MKAVLLPITPKWCNLIAKGKKTVEVRKTKPKLETPFKCYIYESLGARTLKEPQGRQKVIGEFVCDEITRYDGEFWDAKTYECVRERYEPGDFEEYGEYEYETIADNEQENYKDVPLFMNSCLTWEELRKYLGKGDHVFYGWHISDLKIYDEPKQLGEFKKACMLGTGCEDCDDIYFTNCKNALTRPPQSWCYVEELE